MMVAHGLCSSGLFRALGEYYSKVKRRRIAISRGLGMLFPRTIVW